MTQLAQAVAILVNVTAAAAELSQRAQQIGAAVQRAQAEGRDTFTDSEWAQIRGIDDAARARLQAAIDAAG